MFLSLYSVVVVCTRERLYKQSTSDPTFEGIYKIRNQISLPVEPGSIDFQNNVNFCVKLGCKALSVIRASRHGPKSVAGMHIYYLRIAALLDSVHPSLTKRTHPQITRHFSR